MRACVVKMTTLDIDAVSGRIEFTECIAAVQEWKIEHDISTIPSYTNMTLYNHDPGATKIYDLVITSESDVEFLLLSHRH